MTTQYRDDQINVIQTAAPIPPGVWILGGIAFACGVVVAALAVMGNIVAIMTITAVATTTLIVIGFLLGNGRRNTDWNGRAACMGAGDEQWKIAMESRVDLLSKVSKVQADQALTQHRGAGAEVRLRGNGNGSTSVEELVLGADFTDGLT